LSSAQRSDWSPTLDIYRYIYAYILHNTLEVVVSHSELINLPPNTTGPPPPDAFEAECWTLNHQPGVSAGSPEPMLTPSHQILIPIFQSLNGVGSREPMSPVAEFQHLKPKSRTRWGAGNPCLQLTSGHWSRHQSGSASRPFHWGGFWTRWEMLCGARAAGIPWLMIQHVGFGVMLCGARAAGMS
jgi:hypothetical protein